MPRDDSSSIVYQEIFRALHLLTNKNPNQTVGLTDIVQMTQDLIMENDAHPSGLEGNIKKIKAAVYKLREKGLIGCIGYNKYCWKELSGYQKKIAMEIQVHPSSFATSSDREHFEPDAENKSAPVQKSRLNSKTTDPNSNDIQLLPSPLTVPPDPQHFEPNPENDSGVEQKSRLDPKSKSRYSEYKSTDSYSGDEYARALNQFHAKKKVEKSGKKAPLPGARQVSNGMKRKLELANSNNMLAKRRKLYHSDTQVNSDYGEKCFGEDQSRGDSSSGNEM